MLYFLENIDTSKTFKQEFLLNHTNDAFFMSELPEYIWSYRSLISSVLIFRDKISLAETRLSKLDSKLLNYLP